MSYALAASLPSQCHYPAVAAISFILGCNLTLLFLERLHAPLHAPRGCMPFYACMPLCLHASRGCMPFYA